jgi:hypothetical protein
VLKLAKGIYANGDGKGLDVAGEKINFRIDVELYFFSTSNLAFCVQKCMYRKVRRRPKDHSHSVTACEVSEGRDLLLAHIISI